MTKLYSLFNLCNELKLLQGSQRTSWLREDRSYKYLKLLSCLVKKKKKKSAHHVKQDTVQNDRSFPNRW